MLSSMELSCEDLSVVAATLANGGVNPFTNVRVFSVREPHSATAARLIEALN